MHVCISQASRDEYLSILGQIHSCDLLPFPGFAPSPRHMEVWTEKKTSWKWGFHVVSVAWEPHEKKKPSSEWSRSRDCHCQGSQIYETIQWSLEYYMRTSGAVLLNADHSLVASSANNCWWCRCARRCLESLETNHGFYLATPSLVWYPHLATDFLRNSSKYFRILLFALLPWPKASWKNPPASPVHCHEMS